MDLCSQLCLSLWPFFVVVCSPPFVKTCSSSVLSDKKISRMTRCQFFKTNDNSKVSNQAFKAIFMQFLKCCSVVCEKQSCSSSVLKKLEWSLHTWCEELNSIYKTDCLHREWRTMLTSSDDYSRRSWVSSRGTSNGFFSEKRKSGRNWRSELK